MGNITEISLEIDDPLNNDRHIISETKNDRPPHDGKKIDKLIISQYIDGHNGGEDDSVVVVTYSKEDNSIVGWSIGENGQIPKITLKLYKDYIKSFVLHKEILVFRCEKNKKDPYSK
jgi:hypothetical protein